MKYVLMMSLFLFSGVCSFAGNLNVKIEGGEVSGKLVMKNSLWINENKVRESSESKDISTYARVKSVGLEYLQKIDSRVLELGMGAKYSWYDVKTEKTDSFSDGGLGFQLYDTAYLYGIVKLNIADISSGKTSFFVNIGGGYTPNSGESSFYETYNEWTGKYETLNGKSSQYSFLIEYGLGFEMYDRVSIGLVIANHTRYNNLQDMTTTVNVDKSENVIKKKRDVESIMGESKISIAYKF